MADLTKEQYEQLPDFVQGDYQEVDGVYKHAGVIKLKGSLDELDNKYKGQLLEVNEKLSNFEKTQQAEIEKARADALEEAKSKGDVDAIERRYQEQMADLEKRTAEKVRGEVEKEFTVKSAQQQNTAEIADLVSKLKPLDDDAAEMLKIAISKRRQVGEDGKIINLNSDGSASSLDNNGLLDELRKSGAVKRLIQGETNVNGGGLANGSKGGGGAPTSGANMGGSREQRKAAIAQKYNLPS